ncbi:hypothetical protein Bp8pC_185 [Bacillus phage Bp8p-C]|uniref:Uncharacterized protein n=2 Tax=Agatevirus Bp8pC TaxID=1910937 RepID=A0A0A0PLL9_9CAUD|nr:hypothetical protein AXJ20_gp163 [Bacillus phage Bp8p-C]YP_009784485.1 hypothetical protein QLX39_gp163 [Bacillus phage Bp8p-T]AHJ87615.1 hypothetical protein Bp8pC_185 [Bacillus phage Bp8p-C]AHJ87826.1 hypothetical protein Bp8pT_185 [Bacillus phage Bp8p-T]
MMDERIKAREAIERYLLSNLEETMDYIDVVYHYDYSLQDVQAYRNTNEIIDGLFATPSEALNATKSGKYDRHLPYFFFNGNQIWSTSARNQELAIQNNITDIALTLVSYSDELEFNFTDELKSFIDNRKKYEQEQGSR